MGKFWVLGAGAVLLLAACGEKTGDETATLSDCQGDGVVVTDAWARAARPGRPTSAAYLTLCSTLDDVALIGGEMAGVTAVELHQTLQSADGVASMSPTERIALPKGEAVSLAPGGSHFMLIGLGDGIAAESPPTIVLQFENAPSQEIVLEVREIAKEKHH